MTRDDMQKLAQSCGAYIYYPINPGSAIVFNPDQLEAFAAALRASEDAQGDPENLLPHGYLFAKCAMVVPLLEEARDALTALSVAQLKLHRISPTLADRMDFAGEYALTDWIAARAATRTPGKEGEK